MGRKEDSSLYHQVYVMDWGWKDCHCGLTDVFLYANKYPLASLAISFNKVLSLWLDSIILKFKNFKNTYEAGGFYFVSKYIKNFKTILL